MRLEGLQKAALRIRRYKPDLHGLPADAHRKGEKGCCDGLLADVHKAIFDGCRSAKEKHAFKSPVRKKENFLVISCRMGQYIAEKIVGYQIRFDPAVLAGNQSVRLF